MQEIDKRMCCSILTVGTELVTGQTVDTNSAYLSGLLEEGAFFVDRHFSVPDQHDAIVSALEFLMHHADTVLVVGGLGPTQDDITKNAIATFTKRPLQKNSRLAASLATFSPFSPVSEQMVALPAPVDQLFISNVGTAPAFSIEVENKRLVCLPGVPMEMKLLFVEQVLPYLRKHTTKEKQYMRKLYFPCCEERSVEEALLSVMDKEVTYGIYPSFGYVILLIKAREEALLVHLESQLKETFFLLRLAPNMSIAATIVKQLEARVLTLAVAESCTGGLLAHKITQVPGASAVFRGGMVVYTNEAKDTLLGVDPAILMQHGAVSEEVAKQMSIKVKEKFQADIGIGITGIAGPSGGTAEKPVGTVYVAITEEETTVYAIPAQRLESREAVQDLSVNWALGQLIKEVSKNSL